MDQLDNDGYVVIDSNEMSFLNMHDHVLYEIMDDGQLIDEFFDWKNMNAYENLRWYAEEDKIPKAMKDAMTNDIVSLFRTLKFGKPHLTNESIVMKERGCNKQNWQVHNLDGYFAIWPYHPSKYVGGYCINIIEVSLLYGDLSKFISLI